MPSPPPRFPTTTRYQCVGTLGQGGMGAVFEVFDRELGRHVALKTVLERDAQSVDSIVDEFRARQRVVHPNLLQLLELVVEPHQCFFTMELLEAVDLNRWVRLNDPTLNAPTEPLAALVSLELEAAAQKGHGLRLHEPQLRLLAHSACAVLSALHALHRAGLVHRDIKPANILVTPSGRTVLADFGLATAFVRAPGEPRKAHVIAGTPGYFAPELFHGAITAAADLYGLGATLYSILVGEAPAGFELAELERGLGAVDPRWVSLVLGLLDPNAAARPRADEAFAELAGLADAPELRLVYDLGLRRAESKAPPSVAGGFVGRELELERVAQAIEAASDRDHATVVHVRGGSGMGKTALVRHALASSRVDGLLVLRGRCHPDEQVAFGGFDEIVDELCSHLMARHDGPPTTSDVDALCTVFPRLRAVWPAPPPDGSPPAESPRSLQRRAFVALQRLLGGLAQQHRLVVWLEDVHWMDEDSRALLEVLRSDGGASRTTLLLCYRPAEPDARPLAAPFPPLGHGCVVIDLAPLPDADVLTMLRALGALSANLHELVRAAQGIPIFAEVLGRHALRVSAADLVDTIANDAPLVHVLEQQMGELDRGQLAVLSLVSLSPRPLRREILLRVPDDTISPADIVHLTQMGFLSATRLDGQQRITVFHDRIRQARLAALRDVTVVALHEQLAAAYALAEPTADEALSQHLAGARRFREAGTHALRAAEGAEQQLAFGAAAGLYARALEWLPDHPERGALTAKLAEARANQGLGDAAGRAFEAAAEVFTGAQSLRRSELLVRAAEQYFHSGCVADGYRVLRSVLERFELRVPHSRARCFAASTWLRLRFIARGTNLRMQPPKTDAWTAAKLDALWMACTSLAHINHSLSDVLILMHLERALEAGAVQHVFRALTLEAAAEATVGGGWFDRRSARLLSVADDLKGFAPSAYEQAWISVSRAACAFFGARWREVARSANEAEEHLLRHRVGVSWERGVNHMYWLFALALEGDVEGLVERHEVAFRDARERDDALAMNTCRSGYSVLVWLYRDDVLGARQAIANLLDGERWLEPERARRAPWPEGGFRTPDYHNVLARTLVHLYVDEACEAYRGIRSAWPDLRAAMLLMVQFVGIDLRYLRARSALAARRVLLTSERPAEWPERWTPAHLLDDARAQLRILRRSTNRVARPYALSLDGALQGDGARRRQLMEEASGCFHGVGMEMHARALAVALGGHEATCSQAVARTLVAMG